MRTCTVSSAFFTARQRYEPGATGSPETALKEFLSVSEKALNREYTGQLLLLRQLPHMISPNRVLHARLQARMITMPGLGKIKRGIRRAFVANPGASLTTGVR
jgi:hypothetical protein